MERLSVQFLASHLWFWGLLLIPACALAFWAYYRVLAPLGRPARWALWLLRGLAFACVLLALAQPILTAEIREGGKPRLALLLDRSGSMRLPAGEGTRTRGEELGRVRSQLREELEGRFRLDEFSFGERLAPLAGDSLPESEGSTALGSALEEALAATESRPVSGYVIVSDGMNTLGRDPVRTAAAATAPIFTVAVGPREPVPDLEIRSVRSNPTAFLGEPLPIRAILSSWNLGGRKATLEVRQADRLLASAEVPLIGETGLEQEVSLEVRPTTAGVNLLEVRLGGWRDSVPANDRRLIAVDVLERKTRVLVLAGRLDWDYAYLARTYSADTTLGYSFLVQMRPGDYAPRGEARARRLPESVADLREFAAVVLVGYEERGLPAPTLEAIARFVREGGGLLVLGGPARSASWAGQGSFASTLPAELQVEGAARAFPVALTLEGQRHPATALTDDPGEAARQWAALPPVQQPGGSLLARPAAKSLLEFRPPHGPASPALATQFVERGKSAWLYARGVWRWDLQAAGASDATPLFSQFCLGLTRWLAEPAVRDRFQVEPARRVFQNGEPVAFRAALWNEAYAPVTGAAVAVEIRPADPSAASVRHLELQPSAENGGYDGETAPLPPGEYAYQASGRVEAATVTAEGRFWVEVMGPEYSRTGTDREGLAQMAGRSGGLAVDASDLEPLFQRIPQIVRRLGRLHEWELWNHWALFATFVLVLSVEWFLRRRRGLA